LQNDVIFVVAGGPSLIGFDFERLRGKGRVLCVNDAFRSVPFADWVFSSDWRWFVRRRKELLRSKLKIKGFFAVQEKHKFFDPQFYFFKRSRESGFSVIADTVHVGRTSGFGALNLAFLFNPRKICLLGFDYKGNDHFYPAYEWYGHSRQALLEKSVRDFDNLNCFHVVNLNPNSALKQFRFENIDEVLE